MMFFTVANHNDAKNPKGFINYENVEFSDIPQMVMSGYAYAAGKFKDNHRKNDNWVGCVDVIILDIDEGCTINQAQYIFKSYDHFIITTRSHKKDKNGLVCDRFRIFLQLQKTINDGDIIDKLIKKIMGLYFFVDQSTSDKGRFYFASPENSEVYYNAGKKFPVIVTETPLQPIKEVKTINVSTNDIYRLDELRNVWVTSNGDELSCGYDDNGINYDSKLKGIQSFLDKDFYDGNKHCCLVSCIYMMRGDGFDDDHIINFLYDETSKRIPVKINDIVNIAKRLK